VIKGGFDVGRGSTLETSGKDEKNTLETGGEDEKNTLETGGENGKKYTRNKWIRLYRMNSNKSATACRGVRAPGACLTTTFKLSRKIHSKRTSSPLVSSGVFTSSPLVLSVVSSIVLISRFLQISLLVFFVAVAVRARMETSSNFFAILDRLEYDCKFP
jgi:hypothetical protein